jgi:phosphohistidine swiveling domain-containing protein
MNEKKSNKIKNLEILNQKSKSFIIPSFFFLTFKSWKKKKKIISKFIKQKIKNKCSFIAIRSAFTEEDGNKSFAGAFSTLLNIDINDKDILNKSIKKVFDSYLKHQNTISDNDGVIIQQMIKNTSMSGVVFTKELNTGSPYMVINYDDQSGETDTVTSGIGEYANRTLYIYRNRISSIQSKRFKCLVKVILEIEKIFKSQFLDIEFAMDYRNNIFIFQCRNQINIKKWTKSELLQFNKLINKAQKDYKKIKNSIKTKQLVLGQMPDWNPAEIIGNSPDLLSISLYKFLITDFVWSFARKEMGYKFINKKLMQIFCGRPYINTHYSFNSFIPKKLSKETSKKLVDYWSTKLSKNPHLHDKIEFDVAITFFDFSLNKKLRSSEMSFLTNDERIHIYNTYKDHFIQIFSKKKKTKFNNYVNKISKLKKIQLSNNFNNYSLNKILNDCKYYGTSTFSIFARYGFISKIIIDSLKELKIISKKQSLDFFLSISTCATQLVQDFESLENSKIKEKKFMNKYGFLRPGTYDITSKKYSEMDNFFSNSNLRKRKKINKNLKISRVNLDKIKKKLESFRVEKSSIKTFETDLKRFVFYREESKFIFSKSISRALDLIISNFEKKLNLEDVKFLDINEILKYNKKQISLINLKQKIKKRKNLQKLLQFVRLPQLIVNEKSFHIIPFQVSKANFIVKKKVTSEIVFLDKYKTNIDIDFKIVVIENADPGFDWIFTKNIIGLVTMYGGANSHMAIRSAEFNIACAIGIGEQQFEKLKKVNNITIDGISQKIITNY